MISSELSAADIAAVTGNRGNDGFGGYGNGFEWIIILFLFAMFNGGWGGNRGGGYGGYGMDYGLYPWLNNSQNINGGFRDQMLGSQLSGLQNSVTAGFGDVQNSLCSGFAGVNAGIAAAQNGISQQLFANQIANMQGFNGVQSGQADIRYTIAQENCADRNQSMLNTRDIMENCNRNYQGIMDKLCQLELDGVKGQYAQAQREIVGLQNQLNMAAFRESQTAQNALFQQGLNNEVDALYNRLNNCPVPTTPVYGRTPIFTCNNQNYGCGCGAAAMA